MRINGTNYEGPLRWSSVTTARILEDANGHAVDKDDILAALNAMQTETGEYGEPLYIKKGGDGDHYLLMAFTGTEGHHEGTFRCCLDGEVRYFKRSVACYNACSGMSDPANEIARLREIEKAAKMIINCLPCVGRDEIEKLVTALSKEASND